MHDTRLETFAERVHERRTGPCRLLTLRTPLRSVVTWYGSFVTVPDFESDEELVQNLTVALLDKGTQRLDRFAVAELLENRGAQVRFSSDGLRVELSGRALKDDVPDVFALVAEQLRTPLFDPQEFEKGRARASASLQRSMESTAAQASGALVRSLYARAHPNFSAAPGERLERLSTLDVEHVRAYHAAHFGANDFTLVVVGDVDDTVVEDAVRVHFGDWETHAAPGTFAQSMERRAPVRTVVPIPEKHNVDVRMGHSVSLRRNDADYVPLYLANYALGGNFSARLMQTIRDEMGLTYGIRSGLHGITSDYSGHWQISVTLSLENVDRGIEETAREVRRFVEDGLTPAELTDNKTTITGSFKVGLATTSGLASALLKNAERGFDVGYLDRFPEEVDSVTLETANRVVQTHLDAGALHVAVAGSLAEREDAD